MSINLTYEPRYCPHEFRIISKDGVIGAVNSFYYANASEVYIYGNTFVNSFPAADKLTVEGVSTFKQEAKNIREFISEAETMEGSYAGLTGNTKLKRAIFPNLRTIGGRTDPNVTNVYQLTNCSNIDLELVFPRLQTIGSSIRTDRGAFMGTSNVVIPETVKTIG